MFDTLFIGTSGLLSNAKGLRVVGNNLANVNTPGFKGSQLQFGELFEQGGGVQSGTQQETHGTGVTSLSTQVLFRAGTDQSTGNALDLSIDGNGMFTVKQDDQLMFTRVGDFRFDSNNVLTNSAGDKVQMLDSQGKLADVTLAGLEHNPAKATSVINVTGNLTSTVAVPAVNAALNGLTVIDAAGGSHSVNLSFKDLGSGSYTVTVTDGATGGATLGTGTLKFAGGFPVPGSSTISFNYSTTDVPAFAVQLDFSNTQTGIAATALSMKSQDGYLVGVRTDQSIGADGTVKVSYSNGQTATGPRLALAEFQTESDLLQVGGGFEMKQGAVVHYGHAGDEAFGSLLAGHREGSNVDLAEEFGNLILMQRGYQASSHVISTANDMIQELFDMKGHR